MKKKGYRINYTLADIKKYQHLSAKQKLEWLEAANHFSRRALSARRKAIRDMFRRGKI